VSLLSLQRGLKDHILNGAPAIAPHLKGDPSAGLKVYHNAYRAQLVACLRDTYEKTWAWLGDEQFDAAARAYVAEASPSSWTLNVYGEHFPAFLARRMPDDPEVAELAWLDRALRRAFDGENAEPISGEALGSVDWDNVHLTFVPTLALHPVVSNVAAIWGAIAEETSPPPFERLPTPAFLRVWRLGLSPQYRTIDASEMAAIEAVLAGQSFGDVCAAAGEGLDEDAATAMIGAMLSSWIQDGLIAGAEVPAS
jgi:hypothetical protein